MLVSQSCGENKVDFPKTVAALSTSVIYALWIKPNPSDEPWSFPSNEM